MDDLNKTYQTGRLTGNPELKYTPSGTAVCNFSIAINSSFKTKADEVKQETCFVEVVTFGRQAETSGEYLRKGSSVLVEGKLQLDTWEDKDNNKRQKHRVRARMVRFLDPPRDETAKAAEEPASAPAQAPVNEDDMPF